ncbi:sterol desaturase family protein [Parasphingorhabdus cellanae]|uniref:Sterol desaturase family protein n=1 Tax=Parasphingorhabdus cellanae TaxID=2806553 RepID=A0ABX7T925_9SPHN|nr:sterol desaturase family protein [Parasphingorhabdus cellanae]QTD57014.1 sterol desaturase family protein [Parasphingorhabdus cellanae]
MSFLEQYETIVRLGTFAGIFLVMALLELAIPRKQRVLAKGGRWFTNISLVIVDTLALRLIIPILAVAMANYAAGRGWGLLALVDLPLWIEVIIAFLLLDMLIYAQHIAFHRIPILWRFHKVHHADRDLDVTSGARFHPGEAVFSMAYKLLFIVLIGPAAFAVFLFEVLLNAASMFNHANIRLPLGFDRLLRLFIVTPDMHRVHHSIIEREANSNYSFFLTIWDRMFGTYIAQPEKGHNGMTIGLSEYQDNKPANLIWSLIIPFMRSKNAEIKTGGNSMEERRPVFKSD